MDDSAHDQERAEILHLARPLRTTDDLDPLLHAFSDRRIVCLGEASHGTHEFYSWRCEFSRRLIEQGRTAFIGVEGDWPDCWRIDRWVRGETSIEADARHLLAGFERWPQWMWANEEVADFLDWLRAHNRDREPTQRVGFYGLDVYSLWDSLRAVFDWLTLNAPESLDAADEAWRCFAPFNEDPQNYARSSLRLVPESCVEEVANLLASVRRVALVKADDDDAAFAAAQNAEVIAGAEHYYRAMVRSDAASWNIRDHHMASTLERLMNHFGDDGRAIVWAHNTHVGDARATDMARAGMTNLGQLARTTWGVDRVALIGFGSHRGSVIAANTWGTTETVLDVPPAPPSSHEGLLHSTLGEPALLIFESDRTGPWMSTVRGHRAIGVVYRPTREFGNYVPTVMGRRYDAFLWFEDTTALTPLLHEPPITEGEYETSPSGY